MDKRDKIFWYLLFSIIGVFSDEVCSWTSPFAFLNPINFLIVWPIYAFHYFLFVPIILEKKWYKDWRVIYLFGVLLGLYEFWITKSYFVNFTNELLPTYFPLIAGISLLNLLWLGFIWHPIFGFLIPFYIMVFLFFPVERKYAEIKLRRIFYAMSITFAVFGVTSTIAGELSKINEYFLLPVLMMLIPFEIMLIFQFIGFRFRNKKMKLADFIVTKRTKAAIAIALGLIYVYYGITYRPELLPKNPITYIYIATIYILIILLIAKLQKKSFFRIKGEPIINDIDRRDISVYVLRLYVISLIVWIISMFSLPIFLYVLLFLLYISPAIVVYIFIRILIVEMKGE